MAASLRGAVRVATSLAHRTLGLGTGDRVGVYCMIQSNRVGPGLQVGAKKADSKSEKSGAVMSERPPGPDTIGVKWLWS